MSISNVTQQPPPPPPRGGGSKELSSDQEALLEEVLAEYDLENLSASDLESLAADIEETGIDVGRGLGDALRDAGVSSEDLSQLKEISESNSASSSAPPPPPPEAGQGGFSINEELLSALTSLSESLSSNEEVDNDAISALQELLEKNGIPPKGSIVDGVA